MATSLRIGHELGQAASLPLDVVRVSLGTAGVLGLGPVVQVTPPTTAYLMVGERCQRDCAFCTQARTSRASADALSRITWPLYELADVVIATGQAWRKGLIQRCCLQVTASPGYLEQAEYLLACLRQEAPIPLSLSVVAHGLGDLQRLFQAGAERVALALDAATAPLYRAVKGPGWERAMALLEEAASRFPGRISTHVIVGLGETEADLVRLFQRLAEQGIRIGLFAFTPVPGTALEGHTPPPLAAYRRVQAARFLIESGHARAEDFAFAPDGRIVDYGLSSQRLLRELLADGQAFQTAGCDGCNRPYYNERPSGPMYNYPRPLTPSEALEAVTLAIG